MSNEPTETEAASVPESSGAVPEPAAVSAEELAALKEKAAQADAFKDRYLRSVADLENFRKRAARERQEAVQYANQSLMEKLVPALDNLDMALSAVSAASASGTSSDSLKTGVEMVLAQVKGALREAGLEEIDALGQTFDPSWHEAVSQQETADVPEGQVVQQLRKGYRLQQRLVRPATVVVARAPQN
ncbi:MAG: nucleotide exchange factor GrpE [Verrucomicrobiales bacterium]|nr:nucleotide exchange factor GrpE [Verrucomicrobiales bacterium]